MKPTDIVRRYNESLASATDTLPRCMFNNYSELLGRFDEACAS